MDPVQPTYSAQSARRAPLITLVSASGGVGKSTIALIAAHLTAARGTKTAIVEGDLQFGDMGFWLGLDVKLSSLAQGETCIPVPISAQLDLFKAPVLPEVAEEISEAAARLVEGSRTSYDLVIADTGQFWSGLTGELLCNSDLVLLVMDQRRSSVYGAIKALELCQRLGIPGARIAFVLNRASGLSRGEIERIEDSLGCEELFRLADGKASVEALVGTGRIEELVEEGASPTSDVESLLAALLPRIGIEFSASERKRARRFFP
ncbi:MAG: hypothetical protein V8R08_03265 [Coriobacteriales bacterium]